MPIVTLVTFRGCPNADKARQALQRAGVAFRDIDQGSLPAGDPLLDYTSPTILIDGKLIYGARTESGRGGCSIEPFDEVKLMAAIRGITASG